MVTAIRNTSAWPLILQFTSSLVAIISVFLIQFPLEEKRFGVPFAFFFISVFMMASHVGRPAAFFAVALSTPLCRSSSLPCPFTSRARWLQIEGYTGP